MSSQTLQENVIAGVQNLNINEEKLAHVSVAPNDMAQVEPVQNHPPPPFLSGVPMVNPGGNYNMDPNPQPVMSQQPMLQTQSVVSNMAAYSSSKLLYFLFIFWLNKLLYGSGFELKIFRTVTPAGYSRDIPS